MHFINKSKVRKRETVEKKSENIAEEKHSKGDKKQIVKNVDDMESII